jgi:hypothetical protein
MRLLAWNIRQGGGTRLRLIAEALARHEADVLVLSEYRGGDSALRLREAWPGSAIRMSRRRCRRRAKAGCWSPRAADFALMPR